MWRLLLRYVWIFSLGQVAMATHQQDRFKFGETDWDKHIYGPEDWDLVQCDDVESCPGWPTNWEKYNPFIPYDITENVCKHCPNSVEGVCIDHMQSPLHLLRNVTGERECIDRHRMNYVEGNCLINRFEFAILPHVLRAYQPTTCGVEPVIDFSRGFPFPWLLKFTDISVPSQHMQDGKRYHAEVSLSHVYSVNNGAKMIGNVAIFLEQGSRHDHYDFLELYIREWLKTANKIKRKCARRRLLRNSNVTNFEDDEERPQNVVEMDNTDGFDVDQERSRNRELWEIPTLTRNYFSREFHPYDWVSKVGTEYYFRYKGSAIEPPCFEEVHWRVLKDPIKVSPRQIRLLERLISNRIDPDTCEAYTAGVPRNQNTWRVNVNRPIQTTTEEHRLVYCECVDWNSRAVNDEAYCALSFEERGVINVTWPELQVNSSNFTRV